MSGKVVGMVFDFYPGKGAELLLAVKLADNAHEDGTSIYPSIGTLAELTRQSERSVQYLIKRMVDAGWLVLVRHAIGGGRGGGKGRPREYRIHPDWMWQHDRKMPDEGRPTWFPKPGGAPKQMGATSAPICLEKWVQPDAEMGAKATAEMRAIAVAPEPSLTVIEPNTPQPPAGGASGFEAIWQAYPRKFAEGRARRQWRRLEPDAALQARMLAAIAAQAATDAWKREDGRYVPMLSNWLYGERWKDETAVAVVDQGHAADSRAAIEQLAAVHGIGSWDSMREVWSVYRTRVQASARRAVNGTD